MKPTRTHLFLASALAAAIAVPAVTGAQPAPAPKFESEKCFGIAKAGKNDCAANGHACQGQGKADSNAREWIYVPSGTCERIVGGSLAAK